MMQSVAMGEIQHVESSEDYIMVHQPDEMRDDLSDDDSYDYCEDVYSLHSTAQSMSTCSGAAENVVPKDVIVTVSKGLMEDLDDTHAAAELAHISVPSVLMKDLDEAHAAAELARIPDLEQRSVASALSCSKSAHPATDKVVCDEATSKIGKDVQDALTLSRASNKKRRKTLKLMKKAQAAASAAQSLSEKARAAARSNLCPQKASKSKMRQPGSRSSKKVANIAVACATETLSAYREELLRNKQQCV
jgi:hypothetical protein